MRQAKKPKLSSPVAIPQSSSYIGMIRTVLCIVRLQSSIWPFFVGTTSVHNRIAENEVFRNLINQLDPRLLCAW